MDLQGPGTIYVSGEQRHTALPSPRTYHESAPLQCTPSEPRQEENQSCPLSFSGLLPSLFNIVPKGTQLSTAWTFTAEGKQWQSHETVAQP